MRIPLVCVCSSCFPSPSGQHRWAYECLHTWQVVQEKNWNWVTHYLYSKQKQACTLSVREDNLIPQSAKCKHCCEKCLKQRSARALNCWHIRQECAWHTKDRSPTYSQDSSSCKLQRPNLNLFKQTKTKEGEEKIYWLPKLSLSFSLSPFPLCCLHPLTGILLVILRGLATCSTNPQTGHVFLQPF